MKKFLVVLVIVAMTCMSSMAFAADIAVSGSIDYLLRSFNKPGPERAIRTITGTPPRSGYGLNIDAKAGDATERPYRP